MKQVEAESYIAMRTFFQEMRKSKGFTQTQLAKEVGAEQSDISKIERGERRLDVVELIYICKALGVSAQEFTARLERRLMQEKHND